MFTRAFFIFVVVFSGAAHADDPPQRELFPGLTTNRVVYGKPYELWGKRLVFTNWHYINTGDLDWQLDDGTSVYVNGDVDMFAAHHIGALAPSGIRIVAEKPTVMGPLANQPFRTILKDGDLYRGWAGMEYMESKDGLQWEVKGTLNSDEIYHVFIDPTAPPEERFKAVWQDDITKEAFEAFRAKRPDGWEPRSIVHWNDNGTVAAIRGAMSADGITWNTLPDPLVIEYADTLNTAYYDRALHKYVIYTRYWSLGATSEKVAPDIRNNWTDVGRRAIGRTESSDFRSFPPSEMILEPSLDMLPSESLYTNCRTTIPGAPDQFLMFPAIWNASVDDTTRIGLASSHDGQVWHWVPGGDLMRTASFGEWNGGCIWTVPELIEWPNGDWALPYIGHNVPHKYPRGQRKSESGYAVWPKGRLIALEAEEHGEFYVVPIIAPGRVLKINAETKRTGWIKVSVPGVEGRAIDDCTPIVGSQFWTPVKWKGGDDMGIEAGRPMMLKVEMYQAKLYGFEFE